MSDTIYLEQTFTPREQHPLGQYPALCVDLIDLGERVEQFQGGPKKLSRKLVFVFMTGLKDSEDRPFVIDHEMTLASGDRAGLPKFLGAWRGTPVTEDEIRGKLNLTKEFVGRGCILNMANKPTKTGPRAGMPRTVLFGISPLFPGVPIPVLPPYTRAEFWGKRKAEIALEASAFKAELAAEQAKLSSAGGIVASAPPAGLTDEQQVARAIAAEQKAQDDLPPF